MREGTRRLKPIEAVIAWSAVIAFAYVSAIYLGVIIATFIGVDAIIGRLALHSFLLMVMLAIVWRSPTLFGRPPLTLRDAGLSRLLEWKHILIGVLGFFAYIGIMMLVVPILKQVAWFDINQPQELGLGGMGGPTLFAGFIVLVIITPVVEEVLFRGILQGKLRGAGVAFVPTAVIVGALFGVAHGQWNVAIDVFFMSLVASYLREKTGQLWPSIIVHVCKNMLAFYAMFVLGGGGL